MVFLFFLCELILLPFVSTGTRSQFHYPGNSSKMGRPTHWQSYLEGHCTNYFKIVMCILCRWHVDVHKGRRAHRDACEQRGEGQNSWFLWERHKWATSYCKDFISAGKMLTVMSNNSCLLCPFLDCNIGWQPLWLFVWCPQIKRFHALCHLVAGVLAGSSWNQQVPANCYTPSYASISHALNSPCHGH